MTPKCYCWHTYPILGACVYTHTHTSIHTCSHINACLDASNTSENATVSRPARPAGAIVVWFVPPGLRGMNDSWAFLLAGHVAFSLNLCLPSPKLRIQKMACVLLLALLRFTATHSIVVTVSQRSSYKIERPRE